VSVLLLPSLTVGHRTAFAEGIGLAEAVRTTVERDPATLAAREELRRSEAAVDVADADFDVVVSANLSHAHQIVPLLGGERPLFGGAAGTRSEITDYQIQLQKKFAPGTVLQPGAELQRVEAYDDPVSGAGSSPQIASRTSVGLTVVQPLLRGRGSDATLAAERSAESLTRASQADLAFTTAIAVQRTVAAYWTYLAATKTVEITKDSEARASLVVEQTAKLIKATRRPPSDKKSVEANLRDKLAARIAAEQAMFEARHALGVAMGLDLQAIDALGPPADPFPELAPIELSAADRARLGDLALGARADLSARRERAEADRALLIGLENGLLAALDLSARVGYAGLDEGPGPARFFTPFGAHLAGPEAQLSLSLSWPVENRAARGAHRRQQAVLEEDVIAVQDLARVIRASVQADADQVERASARLRAAKEAVRFHQMAVEDLEKKLKSGLATVTDVILIEDRRSSARAAEVSAVQATLTAIALLRFEVGALLEGGAGSLTSVPKDIATR
jgi:outer membrane protein TolC